MKIRHVEQPEIPQLFALLRAKAAFDGCHEPLRATVSTLHGAIFAEQPLTRALAAEVDGRLVGEAAIQELAHAERYTT